ncbi:MAG: hypothetical protein N3A38_04165, partial [Planctomycetota bacterium]|nr:hypothetical protein [Planctomycetota bacterium]
YADIPRPGRPVLESVPVLLQGGPVRWVRQAALAEVLARGVLERDVVPAPAWRWFSGWWSRPARPLRSSPPKAEDF